MSKRQLPSYRIVVLLAALMVVSVPTLSFFGGASGVSIFTLEAFAAPSDVIRHFRRAAPPQPPAARQLARPPAISRIKPDRAIPRRDYAAIKRGLRIPRHWRMKRTLPGNHGVTGVEFRNPSNPDFHNVRVMPGRSDAQFDSQRRPYVVHTIDGHQRDIYGAPHGRKAKETHIPLEIYSFESVEF